MVFSVYINADLHLHSRYSGATSDKMTIETISLEAPRKGIHVVATGDCLNASWMKEIKTCAVVDEGTFQMNNTRFILSTEVEDQRRVHHLLYFPSISAADDFKERIKNKSKNLDTDGRPNVALSGEELAQHAKDVDALIGPAHAFTPWTAMYAYHHSLKDCYGSLAEYVAFVELGLSADTNYADMIQELHRLTFLTNSDSHSPHPVRLAREFTRFTVEEPTFSELKKAILRTKGNKPVLNVGLPPQEGKYNESACISCYTHYTLEEAQRRKWKCSCGKRIKKGVRDRILEIANFKEPHHPDHRPPYLHVIPLAEIIAKALDQHTPFTQTVSKRWDELITTFGNEITVLIDADIQAIARVTVPAVTEAIQAFRDKKVRIIPGGGGKYGIIELPKENRTNIQTPITPHDHQTSLLDYQQ
ncbi:MAG: TIGR00375 family protein [Candidatus Thermoplasmatota archaeon]